MKAKKIPKTPLIIFLLVTSAIAVYFLFLKREKVYQGEPAEVEFCIAKIEATSMARIALRLNLFKKHGINVVLQEKELGKDCLNSLLAGKADLATSAEAPLVRAGFKGQNFKLLSTMHTASRNVKLLTKRSYGVDNLVDIKGKTIGVPIGSVAEFFLYDILNHIALDFSDVTVVDGTAEELSQKFLNQEIDAICLREPYIYRLSQQIDPDNIFVSYGKDNFLSTFNLVGDGDYVANNPEVVKRFLSALYEAEQFISKRKRLAMLIISRDLQLDMDYLIESCKGADCSLVLDQRLLLEMESEADWLVEKGEYQAEQIPEYLDYFELDLLEAVKPNSTQTLR